MKGDSTMIRIGICDDSSAFLQQTKFMIDHWDDGPHSIITELYEDGDSLIQSHTELPFDIIFLDVLMPLQNGIDVAKEIREKDQTVKIVFLTSSPEFALDSYSVKANNYLLKPVNPTVLFACLEDLLKDMAYKSEYIHVKSVNALHKIMLSDIEYIEAQNKHNLFHLLSGQIIESTAPLYTYEDKLTLENGFFKCHRGYIVNMTMIDTYTYNDIEMHSKNRIPISRSNRKEFESVYFSIIFGKAGEDR